MSHVADVQMKVKDLDALKAVCVDLGLTFMEGQTTHEWYGVFLNDWSSQQAAVNRVDPKTFGKCLHAIKVPGSSYEIGVTARPDGDGYDLIYDTFGSNGGSISQRLGGMGLPTLRQNYSVEVTRRELSRKGYRVVTQKQEDGSVRLHATGGR